MPAFICTTCGIQYAESDAPPPRCVICEDERQFVPPSGQSWTQLARLQKSHMAAFRDDAGLLGIGMAPSFAIGQRALLLRRPSGNVLWDCVPLVGREMVELIEGLGGLSAIAISHPHFYATMTEWSHAFGDIPVYIHAADREWVLRDGPSLQFWGGETKEIAPGLTLIRTGGHYEGGSVLHWADGAQGRGALLVGDMLQVVPDRKHLGFMRSYPNLVPLGASAVKGIEARIAPHPYDAIYGAFWDRVIPAGARQAVERSVARHIDWLGREAV